MITKLVRKITIALVSKRSIGSMVTNADHILYESRGEYGVLKFNKPPVNSLNVAKLRMLNDKLDAIEADPNLKGVILTSNLPNVFSGGVDILEMYKCNDPNKLKVFWTHLQDFWLKLYGSKKIFIAAINGHALAFGCVIAMSCDYRLMSNASNYKIGLNAVNLGITAPFWFRDTMINTIGHRECERALCLGNYYNPLEARQIGLVDQLVDQSEDLLNAADTQMKEWCKIPSYARGLTKMLMREGTLKNLMMKREEDKEAFVQSTMSPSLQKTLETYMNSLKNKKK